MTDQQKAQCPDLYRRLLYATLKPGQSAWAYGEYVRKPLQPVNSWLQPGVKAAV